MKSSQISRFIVVIALIFCFFASCKKTEQQKPQSTIEEKPVPQEVIPAKFAITYPENNGQVNRNIITLKGVGAQNGNEIQVEVFTDTWYLQDGSFEIDNDGSWTYAPCYLMGRGSYREHHNIRAKLKKNKVVIAKHTIYDVTALEP